MADRRRRRTLNVPRCTLNIQERRAKGEGSGERMEDGRWRQAIHPLPRRLQASSLRESPSSRSERQPVESRQTAQASALVWSKPPVVRCKPPVVWSKPPVVWSKPLVVWSKPLVVWSKPLVVWHKPLVVWHKPLVVWNKALVVWNKALVVWNKALVVWNKALVVWNKALVVWSKALVVWGKALVVWSKALVVWNKPLVVWSEPLVVWGKAAGIFEPISTFAPRRFPFALGRSKFGREGGSGCHGGARKTRKGSRQQIFRHQRPDGRGRWRIEG